MAAIEIRDVRGGNWDRLRSACRYDCCGASVREGVIVIGPSGAVKVMVAVLPVDFRKGA